MAVLYLLGGGAGTTVSSSNPPAQTKEETETRTDASAESFKAAAVGSAARSDKS
jgi:hypothetical protein